MYDRKEIPAGLRTRLLGGCAAAALLLAVSSTLPGSGANAAGFALKEQSATALGNAFAGSTAGAEDVSYMFFNPAGLIRQEGNQSAVVLSYIVPNAETNNANGVGIVGSSSQDGGVSALVPAVYGMWSVSPDLKLAVGINVPLGLSTEYDTGWEGAFYALDSELKSININPVVAYRVNERVSIGGGIQIQQFEATLTNFDGVGTAEVTGDDWGFGFNLGVLVELSPETRLGAGYRSQVVHVLDGTATVPSGGLVNVGVTADFTAPDSASIGLYHDVSDQWAVMAELGWTGWSTFDQLEVVLDAGPVLSTAPENWDDVFFYALGATWKPNEDWTLRGGVAFDQSPIPDATRTPRLPGNDRTWVALGAQFHPSPNFTVDAGYTHIFVKDASIDITTAPAPNLTADFGGSIDIVTVQGTFRF